jgi:uncharacterized membrane protein required for colicin V production
MTIIDFIILVIVAGFVWKGIRLGLIEAVGGIIGLFVGAFIASHYYQQVSDMLINLLFGSQVLADVLGFLLVFIIINRGIALLFWFIDKVFHIIAIIPFLKTFNRLLGGIFGLIEGLIFIGIIIYFLSGMPFTGGLKQSVENSRFAGIFNTIGKIADPFIPDSVWSGKNYLENLPELPGGLNLDNLPLNNVGNLIKGQPDINLDKGAEQ